MSPRDGAGGPVAVRVMLAQLAVGLDRRRNAEVAAAAVAAAGREHADVVVLPEYASVFAPDGTDPALAEPLDGPFVTAVRQAAATARAAVLVGTLLPGRSPDRAVNAVVAVGPDGRVQGVYHKVHLYDAFGQRESDRLEPGRADAAPLLMDVAGLRFGVLTCYDLRFPESARRLVDAGAEVLVVPAAWADGPLKAMHWRALAVARAIENTAAVVAVGQAGRGVVGRSLVVGPDGVVLMELDARPAVRAVDLDPRAVTRARERDPSLARRRYRVVPCG